MECRIDLTPRFAVPPCSASDNLSPSDRREGVHAAGSEETRAGAKDKP